MTDLAWLAGPSALVAAVATVVFALPWFLTWLGLDIVTGKIGFGGGA